jgi:hypothetical protein
MLPKSRPTIGNHLDTELRTILIDRLAGSPGFIGVFWPISPLIRCAYLKKAVVKDVVGPRHIPTLSWCNPSQKSKSPPIIVSKNSLSALLWTDVKCPLHLKQKGLCWYWLWGNITLNMSRTSLGDAVGFSLLPRWKHRDTQVAVCTIFYPAIRAVAWYVHRGCWYSGYN